MVQEYLGSCNKKNIMILYPVEVEDCNFTPGGSGTGTTYFADETTLHLDGSNTFSIDTGYIGQASITQLGTITSGTWQATPVANAYLANSSLTVSAGTGLTGGGAVSLGGSTSLALSTPVTVANGGTGQTSFASHGVLLGSGSAALNLATVATAGRLFTDKGAAADPAFVTMGGDATINGSGDLSIVKVHGVTYPGLPATNTVPVVTSSNTVTYQTVPNAALANSSVTVNTSSPLTGGGSVSLGGSLTVSFDNQSSNLVFAGPATGSAAAPTFRAIVAADLGTTLAATFGSVGIGGAVVSSKLEVRMSANNNFAAQFFNSVNNTNAGGIAVSAGSNSTLGSPLLQFYRPDGTAIGGVFQASATTISYLTSSDARSKENVTDSVLGLDVLNHIQVCDFNFKNDPERQRMQGFVAQQLFNIYPQAVYVGGVSQKLNPWAVDYGKLTPLLVKAVQELSIQVNELTTKLNQLIGR